MVKTTLKIDGMMCSMCEAHMNDLVRQKAYHEFQNGIVGAYTIGAMIWTILIMPPCCACRRC